MRQLFTILFLLASFTADSQSEEMSWNLNQIEKSFTDTTDKIDFLSFNFKTEQHLSLFAKVKNDSTISAFLLNITGEKQNVDRQDNSLFLIQEAKDKKGNWKPIEYWIRSTCGNSFFDETLSGLERIKTDVLYRKGNYATEMRLKLLNEGQIYYSNIFAGHIFLQQFEVPEDLIEKVFRSPWTEKLGKEVLLKQLFLDPNWEKEFTKRRKEIRQEIENN